MRAGGSGSLPGGILPPPPSPQTPGLIQGTQPLGYLTGVNNELEYKIVAVIKVVQS